MGKSCAITVVGSLIFDFVAGAQRLPRKGETISGTSFGMFCGGKGANQAVQAARLGASVAMVGRVGADFMGERLTESMRADEIDTETVLVDPLEPTASCCIHVDAEGNNDIIVYPGANMRVTAEDIEGARSKIEAADIVLLQHEIPFPAIVRAVEIAKRAGARVLLNPAPARELPPGLAKTVDLFTPNETEAEYYAGLPLDERDPVSWGEAAARRLAGKGYNAVVVTLGKNGAYLAAPGVHKHCPPFRLEKALDATAAGDAFNGALAVALAEGMELENAVTFANAAGALCASRRGAQASLCSRDELTAFLARQST